MTDPLGQSQVIPYLAGLAQKGYRYHILSCEKKNNYAENGAYIAELLKKNQIGWTPLFYTKYPKVLSTLWDIYKLNRKAVALVRQEKFQAAHCRSYIASLTGLKLKKEFGLKFIFDMRGFWADERVEGGIWDLNNPVYKIIYNYFKKKEKDFLFYADCIVSLTEAAKEIILNSPSLVDLPADKAGRGAGLSRSEHRGGAVEASHPVTVIPCCVDLEHFSENNVDREFKNELLKKYGIRQDDFVLSYLGAIGTWYLLDEMLLFFKRLLLTRPGSRFLFITPEDPQNIFHRAKALGVSPSSLIIEKANRKQVPTLLSLSKASVFFIKQSFSKQASSPTKMGEIMAMGIPYVSNSRIGDVDRITSLTGAGTLVDSFSEDQFDRAVKELDRLLEKNKNEIRQGSEKYFSLNEGVKSYSAIIESII